MHHTEIISLMQEFTAKEIDFSCRKVQYVFDLGAIDRISCITNIVLVGYSFPPKLTGIDTHYRYVQNYLSKNLLINKSEKLH